MKRGAEIDVKWLDILDAPSDHPDRATLAVQYTRVDTTQPALAIATTIV